MAEERYEPPVSREKVVDNGGPAFPELGNVGYNSDWQSESGMTLRQWYAGKALTGIVERMNPRGDFPTEQIAARMAVRYADALIAELKGGAA